MHIIVFHIKSNLAAFSKSSFQWLEFHDAFAPSLSLLPFFFLLLLLPSPPLLWRSLRRFHSVSKTPFLLFSLTSSFFQI